MNQRVRVSSGSPWEPVVGFSRALRVGDRKLEIEVKAVVPAGAPDADAHAGGRP